jgi:ATP-dependent DNA helicase RecQ
MQETFSSLKILELQGLIALNDSVGLQSRIHFYYRAQELYEFQVKNQSFDHFIKVLLRSYEGIFDDYVTINEDDLSRRALLSRNETVQLLQNLDRLKILSYQPANDKPQLTYLEERYDLKDLNIDRENLADRKKRFIDACQLFWRNGCHSLRRMRLLSGKK